MQKAVEISRNDMVLRGMMHIPEDQKEKVPMAIIFHGFTGNKMEPHFIFVKLSRRLERVGIASVRFDFLGSGESDGEFCDMTLSNEVLDAEAILNYVKSLDFVDREKIFVVGLSMGGAVASILSGTHASDIASLCLWAPAGNMGKLIEENLAGMAKRGLDIENTENYDLDGLLLGKCFIDDIRTVDIYDKAAGYDKNVLILHGDADQTVPLSASYRYMNIYGDKAKLHIVEGADHTFNKQEWENEVISNTILFLKQQSNR